ncbi:MAG: twin-arginine translocase subunit TatC [Methanobacteriota archaeon]
MDDAGAFSARPVLAHLAELRRRLLRVFAVFGAAFVLAFAFDVRRVAVGGALLPLPVPSFSPTIASRVFARMTSDLVPDGVTLVVTGPLDAVLAQVEVALFLACLSALPVALYEGAAFLVPGLTDRERRVFLATLLPATLLFALGAAFAYFVMVPMLLGTLYAFAPGLGAVPLVTTDRLVSFALLLVLVFGLMFELPVLMAVAARLGLASARGYLRYWRHAILAMFLLAAVITPDPSVVNQVVVAVPLVVLYLVGVVFSAIARA